MISNMDINVVSDVDTYVVSDLDANVVPDVDTYVVSDMDMYVVPDMDTCVASRRDQCSKSGNILQNEGGQFHGNFMAASPIKKTCRIRKVSAR